MQAVFAQQEPLSSTLPQDHSFRGIFNGASTYEQLCQALENDLQRLQPSIFPNNDRKPQPHPAQNQTAVSANPSNNHSSQRMLQTVAQLPHKRRREPTLNESQSCPPQSQNGLLAAWAPQSPMTSSQLPATLQQQKARVPEQASYSEAAPSTSLRSIETVTNEPWWMKPTRSDTQLTYAQQRLREVTKPISVKPPQQLLNPPKRSIQQAPISGTGTTECAMAPPQQLTSRKSSGNLRVGSHCMLSGGAMFAHPQKRRMGRYSEDAYFIADTGRAVGVADGVGGYYTRGIDSGDYARELMAQAKHLAEEPTSSRTASDILHESHARVHLEGASTSCILTLHGDKLHVANLGDSVTVVFRDGKPFFTLEPQQYNFNCPYQMSREDPPEEAISHTVKVRTGDVIVSGSDGLFDNVFLDAIYSTVEGYRRMQGSAVLAAESLANIALRNSLDSNFRSPFRVAAARAGVPFFDGRLAGGKQDDITVVVSFVVGVEQFERESPLYREQQESVIRRMFRLQSVDGGVGNGESRPAARGMQYLTE